MAMASSGLIGGVSDANAGVLFPVGFQSSWYETWHDTTLIVIIALIITMMDTLEIVIFIVQRRVGVWKEKEMIIIDTKRKKRQTLTFLIRLQNWLNENQVPSFEFEKRPKRYVQASVTLASVIFEMETRNGNDLWNLSLYSPSFYQQIVILSIKISFAQRLSWRRIKNVLRNGYLKIS